MIHLARRSFRLRHWVLLISRLHCRQLNWCLKMFLYLTRKSYLPFISPLFMNSEVYLHFSPWTWRYTNASQGIIVQPSVWGSSFTFSPQVTMHCVFVLMMNRVDVSTIFLIRWPVEWWRPACQRLFWCQRIAECGRIFMFSTVNSCVLYHRYSALPVSFRSSFTDILVFLCVLDLSSFDFVVVCRVCLHSSIRFCFAKNAHATFVQIRGG